MSDSILVQLEIPTEIAKFKLPVGVNQRLQDLLDRQDQGDELSPAERLEAEGLVTLSEFLSLLQLHTKRAAREA